MLRWMAAGTALIVCGFAIASAFYGQRLRSSLKTAEVTITGVKEQETKNADVVQWLYGQSADRSREIAYRAFLGEWNFASPEQGNSDACIKARAKGFRCPDERARLKEPVSPLELIHLNNDTGIEGPLFAAGMKGVK